MEVEQSFRDHQQFVLETAKNSKGHLDGVKATLKKQRSKGDKIIARFNIDIGRIVEKKEISATQHKALSQVTKKMEDQLEKLNEERRVMHNRVESMIGEIISTFENE